MSNLDRKHVEIYLNCLGLLSKTPEWVLDKLDKSSDRSELVEDAMNMEGFLKLCKDVSKIDPDAGDWLLNGGFDDCKVSVYNRLSGAFVWFNSPQGSDFWSDINEKLSEGADK